MPKWTVADIPDQTGKVAVVTGANSGIGWYTALELARSGSEVILTTRTEAKGRDAVEKIRRELPKAAVRFELLDLASLESVRMFAVKVGSEPKIDLLVNNAGVMAVPSRQVTKDGFELQLGTNYLGPFALTGLLSPALQRAASPRVTTVSSGAANMGAKKIDFDDLEMEKSYGPWKAYCQSKLADLMFAQELARRSSEAHARDGNRLLSVAAHPGYARTGLQTSGPGKPQSLPQRILAKFVSQDAAQGALPTLRAATEPSATQGSYYGPAGMFGLKGEPVPVSVPSAALDQDAARRLWDISEKLTGVQWLADEQAGSALLER